MGVERKSFFSPLILKVPDTFGPEEVAKLRTLTSWSNYKQFFYLKSCLAIALENGYYECTHDPHFQPARHIIADAGATHLTLLVVSYSKVKLVWTHHSQNKICIEYVRDVPGICGRLFTEKMMECLVSEETIERLKHEDRRNYLHVLDVCEKKKCDLNVSGPRLALELFAGIGEIDVDLSEYIEEDGDRDTSDLQATIDAFSARCAPLVARFDAALQEMCDAIQGFHDSTPLVKVIPSGGAMRTLCLQQTLLRAVRRLGWSQADLSRTLNMDEPVALGAARLARLLEQRSVKLDESVVGTLVFSEDPVEWSAFSTKESDGEICARKGAIAMRSMGRQEPVAPSVESAKRKKMGGVRT